jgi:hypothetical protein
MQEIEKLYSPGIGRHWFDADTMRFFRSRLADFGYQSGDGHIYFVTSEKGPHMKRAYTVRCLTGPKGNINTVGEFQSFGASGTATKYAKGYASGNIALPE